MQYITGIHVTDDDLCFLITQDPKAHDIRSLRLLPDSSKGFFLAASGKEISFEEDFTPTQRFIDAIHVKNKMFVMLINDMGVCVRAFVIPVMKF